MGRRPLDYWVVLRRPVYYRDSMPGGYYPEFLYFHRIPMVEEAVGIRDFGIDFLSLGKITRLSFDRRGITAKRGMFCLKSIADEICTLANAQYGASSSFEDFRVLPVAEAMPFMWDLQLSFDFCRDHLNLARTSRPYPNGQGLNISNPDD